MRPLFLFYIPGTQKYGGCWNLIIHGELLNLEHKLEDAKISSQNWDLKFGLCSKRQFIYGACRTWPAGYQRGGGRTSTLLGSHYSQSWGRHPILPFRSLLTGLLY